MERDPSISGSEHLPERGGEQRDISEKKRHERLADQLIAHEFQRRLEALSERLKLEPTFSENGRTYGIVNEIDYMVARAQMRERIAEEVLRETREAGEYWQEKSAAKLAAFEKITEEIFALYAEAKLYHPELAGALETEHSYLREVYEEAKRNWQARASDSA